MNPQKSDQEEFATVNDDYLQSLYNTLQENIREDVEQYVNSLSTAMVHHNSVNLASAPLSPVAMDVTGAVSAENSYNSAQKLELLIRILRASARITHYINSRSSSKAPAESNN